MYSKMLHMLHHVIYLGQIHAKYSKIDFPFLYLFTCLIDIFTVATVAVVLQSNFIYINDVALSISVTSYHIKLCQFALKSKVLRLP